MTDRFSKHTSSLESPATGAFQITPDDNNDLQEITRALYVGTSGDISITMMDGQEVLFSTVPAGMILPIRAVRIKSTNTTATNLTGLV